MATRQPGEPAQPSDPSALTLILRIAAKHEPEPGSRLLAPPTWTPPAGHLPYEEGGICHLPYKEGGDAARVLELCGPSASGGLIAKARTRTYTRIPDPTR